MKENETEEEFEARIERESVEWVFGLTGGELESKPWEPFVPKPELDERDAAFGAEYGHPSSNVYRFTYWYEGVPDYTGPDEFPELYDTEHRTVVKCFLLGNFGEDPPEELRHEGCLWRRVAMYTSSGETECPLAEGEDGPETVGSERCPYCEADPGDEHGYIYLGDGWAEVVYRREPAYKVMAKYDRTCNANEYDPGDDVIAVGIWANTDPDEAAEALWCEVPSDEVPEDTTEEQWIEAFKVALKDVTLSADPDDMRKAWFTVSWERI